MYTDIDNVCESKTSLGLATDPERHTISKKPSGSELEDAKGFPAPPYREPYKVQYVGSDDQSFHTIGL